LGLLPAPASTAELSDKGRKQSCGAMVNYLYDPAHVARNHETCASKKTLAAARSVKALAVAAKDKK
jgi:malonyl-CoA decarboxylase